MQPLTTGGQWRRATVIKKVSERSYLTQTEEGQVYRRNRKYLGVTFVLQLAIYTPLTLYT